MNQRQHVQDHELLNESRGEGASKVRKAWHTRIRRFVRMDFLRDGDSTPPLGLHGSEYGAKGKWNNLWIVFSALMLMLAAVVVFFPDRIFSPSEHVVLSLSGSTSLGDELMPELAEAFLRDELGAERTGVKVGKKDAKGHPRLHVWGKVPGKPELQVIEIYATGSGDAFKCLAAKSGPDYCDIGMSSRPISNIDKQLYPALRNLVGSTTEHVVALDGIAVIVNPSNPVSQLTIPQLRAIYSGEIGNWSNVGGDNVPIELYGRDQASGTLEIFTEKVMGENQQGKVRPAHVPMNHQVGDSDLLVDAVMRSPNAIGYVSSPLVGSAKALMISDGSGPALKPTELSIVTEDYPICRRLLLYDWDEPGSLMNAFIRYATYKPGQALVAQTPFVGLTPRVFPVVPPRNAPYAYKKLAQNFSRIGLSFHFSSAQAEAGNGAGSQLDSLARVNVLRLRTFLAQHGGTGDDILLIGFADEVEGRATNEHLAHNRAEGVATDLRAIGVIVPPENIKDFGTELPVASNENPEGRTRNRRVEVWVRNGLL
jgi:phosphate transport system substrate-binding protein